MKTLLFACIALLATACTKVPPGYVGVKIDQWGDAKGVSDIPLVTGAVAYNPFMTDIETFPTFRQNIIWDKENGDESLTFNSVEGSVLNADLSMSYSIRPDRVPYVFVKYRKGIDEITHVFLRSEVSDAIQRVASNMKVIDIFGVGKQKLLDETMAEIRKRLGEDFEFEMIAFQGAIRPLSQDVSDSINATIQATQLAISAQNKVVQATAEAQQAIESAKGRSQSVVIEAQARFEAMQLEARGNMELTKSLTPELVRYRTIEKWNGTPPQVMGGDFATMLNVKP